MSKPFAILRVKKLKSRLEIFMMQKHWLRSQPTENVNAKLTRLNKMLLTNTTPLEIYDDTIKSKNIKIRKNAVHALELVLAFSPAFIKVNDSYLPDAKDKLKWWKENTIKWVQQQFAENCQIGIMHLDEQSPHCHFFIIPTEQRKRKSGKIVWTLNARGITGGKAKLVALQDSYAEAMQKYLKRGIKGSKAKHTTLKSFYSIVNQTNNIVIDELKNEKLKYKNISEWSDRAIKLINESNENEILAEITKVKNTKLIIENKKLTLENKKLSELLYRFKHKFEVVTKSVINKLSFKS
ncbi:MAG TPA: hypothetical protein ENH67_20290 [Pseudoalteromonas sp.]|uniref:Plasmid recombination enzyme n=1 Tax=marine sediment metagenome TaxID=412755 RepID=A0A0F9PYL2_9ZZZZ|nr:MobV family relaxase [Pseudoalteromonas sp.]HDY92794.1 hypothetical protein [Pseudoalteromonas sp.]HDZ35163.1 hypothetical protein [Pseudoalteromonas sp.]